MDEVPFGRYTLRGSLGEGGMGQVFRAYDPDHDREVALKVLSPRVAQDPSFEQRFRREARIATRLSDPHVIPIHSYGEIDGRFYVDMPLVSGRDLGSVLAESGPMHPARTVKVIEQVADALDAAHAIGLVHRDIKPSNILLTRKDFAYLIDFGIAQDTNATRMTQAGQAIGTFAYMAPERIETGEAAAASDIYSLACVLHECLTGRLPFPGDSIAQQIASHLSKPPPRPSALVWGVPRSFDDVLARGMAKNPAERYPTVLAFAEAAREALYRDPVTMPPPQQPVPLAQTQVAPPGPVPWSGGPQPALDHVNPDVGGQPRRQANFVAPGVLVAIYAIGRILLGSMYVVDHHAHVDYFVQIEIVTLGLHLALAVAFGVVARRTRASARLVSLAALLTCAGAVLSGLMLPDMVASGVNDMRFVLPSTLIAFGIAAHRAFGKSWLSVPAILTGLIGIAFHVAVNPQDLVYGDGGLVGPLLSIPLLFLGIGMCRTRVRAS